MTDVLDWDGIVREAKNRRAKEGLTQLKHAQLAGVSRDTIRSFDKYERSISLEKAIAILRVVGLVSDVERLRYGAREQADFVRRGLDRWNELVRPLPKDHPSRFPHGRITHDFQLQGEWAPIDGSTLLKLLANISGISGWSPFHVFSKQLLQPTIEVDDEIECWVGRPSEDKVFADASYADYWRASPHGNFLLLRGYQEDGEESQEPGMFLDIALPLWRAADVLEHARSIAEHFPKGVERVILHVTWDGRAGRRRVNWSRPTAMFATRSEHRSRAPSVTNAVTVDGGANDASSLHSLLLPLYAAFDFDLREEDVSNELLRRKSKGRGIISSSANTDTLVDR